MNIILRRRPTKKGDKIAQTRQVKNLKKVSLVILNNKFDSHMLFPLIFVAAAGAGGVVVVVVVVL
jgi:hypothetical protein